MFLQEYTAKIQSGEIIAPKSVIKIYTYLVNEISNVESEYIFDEEKAKRPIVFIEKFCKQSVGVAGGDLKLDLFQKAFIEALFGFVFKTTGYRRFRESLFLVARKNGKALWIEEEIPTPKGFIKMQDLCEGDYVYGADGKPTKVIFKSEVFYNHNCYKVSFEDGSSVIADEEHLWAVKIKRKGLVNLTTKEMFGKVGKFRNDKKGFEYNFRTPLNKAVEYSHQELTINPYLLGVWLGDGASLGSRITCSYDDIEEMNKLVSQCGYESKIVVNKDRAGTIQIVGNGKGRINPFKEKLKELNLISNKHIPDVYLKSSIEQRRELLRGLMDTDGYASKRGECEFSQKDYSFILQFSELLSSLGIKHSIREKRIFCNEVYHKAYSVLFFVDKSNSCFKLQRKHERLKEELNKRMDYKTITSIDVVDSVPTQCIAVDNNDSLYLVGRRMNVTHNTTLLGAIAKYMLIADKEASAECFSVATKQEQAKQTFNTLVAMRQYSPAIQSVTRKRRSDIYVPSTLSFFKPLASNSKSLDGVNSHLVIIDELHAIRNRELYEVMKQSTSSRRQPLLVMITTAGTVRENIFDVIYDYAKKVLNGIVQDDTFLPILYEMDSREEWHNPEMWIKANPGLDNIKQRKYMIDIVERGKNNHKDLSGILVKDFNIRETATDAWLSWATLNNETTFEMSDIENSYAVGGVDLSATTDLTCATLLIVKNGTKYVLQRYFMPEGKLSQRVNEDKIPYDKWGDWITFCEGERVNYNDITLWFNEMRERFAIYPLWIGYDSWASSYWVEEMKAENFIMESVIQGPKTMSSPMKEMAADLAEKKINYGNNPVLKWCLTNTVVKVDTNDNIAPIKGRNQRQRIDGTVALIDSLVVYQNHREDYHNLIG